MYLKSPRRRREKKYSIKASEHILVYLKSPRRNREKKYIVKCIEKCIRSSRMLSGMLSCMLHILVYLKPPRRRREQKLQCKTFRKYLSVPKIASPEVRKTKKAYGAIENGRETKKGYVLSTKKVSILKSLNFSQNRCVPRLAGSAKNQKKLTAQ